MQKALASGLCIMHRLSMGVHRDIVIGAGVERVASVRGLSVHTVRSWAQRDSIPAEHWAWFAGEGLATLEDLARAAAQRAAERQEAA